MTHEQLFCDITTIIGRASPSLARDNSKGILKISGNEFLTTKFLCHYISEGVYYHCTKDLIATPKGKPVAAAGSCSHRKNTAKNWVNISHLVRGQTRVFHAPELIASIYFAQNPSLV